MSSAETIYQQRLDDLKSQSMFRQLRIVDGPQRDRVTVDGREYLLLCSNNYLGIADHPLLTEAAVRATEACGTGSGASRLVSGSLRLHHDLEARIAAFKGTEGALVFNGGYAANTGILQGLLGPEDTIFSDQLNHASIIDGCRLSRARIIAFPHNDMAALRSLLERERPTRNGIWLIVTDGVFSMDGDVAPLAELADLKEEFDALLMVDDAHGTGVFGAGGKGSAEAAGVLDRVDLHMGTLGKGLGSFGAYVAAKQVLIDTLINRARSFIFSTSLPAGVLAASLAGFDLIDSPEGATLRRELWRKRALFADRLLAGGADILGSTSQIVPVLTRDPAPTMAIAARLFEMGIFLQGIRPPTVPAGLCRLRATVMATHRDEDLSGAADAILAILNEREQS